MSDIKTVGTPNHGWLFFLDNCWQWSSQVPPDAVEARRATDWEQFVFNKCGNRSDRILAILAPEL